MEPHPIPRQITTFEFKLIGIMTVKQFLYIVLFGGFGILLFLVIRIPYIRVAIGLITASIGVAFAFVRHNERPLDVWIKNIFLRLTTPSQYFYKKNNDLPSFLMYSPAPADPQIINTHIDAKNKINEYLGVKPELDNVVPEPQPTPQPAETIPTTTTPQTPQPPVVPVVHQVPTTVDTVVANNPDSPYIKGVITNKKGIKLPDIMVYIKDSNNNSVRVLKTDRSGFFSAFKPLETGDYVVEARDLGNNYFFDKVSIHAQPDVPFLDINITSKEIV